MPLLPPAPGPISTAPGKTVIVSNSHSTCPSASPRSTTATYRPSLSFTAPSPSSPSIPPPPPSVGSSYSPPNASATRPPGKSQLTKGRSACFRIPTSRMRLTASINKPSQEQTNKENDYHFQS